ncbi:MAG: hypothetical protein ACK5V3_18335 [Bdellovibrionales bacterium]
MNKILKTLVTGSVLVSALLVTAAERSPRDLSENLVRNAQRTLELITRESDYLTRRQINLVNEKLDEIREIVRNGGSNPVMPNPPPYTPPQPQVINVRGVMETVDFNFDVRDLQGLFQQCTAFVRSRSFSQVDDIKVTVNFGSLQTLRNNESYWKGETEICMQVVEVARRANVPVSYDGRTTVFGAVETVEFSFVGTSKAELFRQCENFINSRNLLQVDDIKIVTNLGSLRVLRNNESYWRGAVEICTQVLRDVR